MGSIVRRLVRSSFKYLCQISICAKPADFRRIITDAQGVGFQCRDLDFVPTAIVFNNLPRTQAFCCPVTPKPSSGDLKARIVPFRGHTYWPTGSAI
jgi:hypothetical protein